MEPSYRVVDLLRKPLARLVRFVLVKHPTRGQLVLLCNDRGPDAKATIPYAYAFNDTQWMRVPVRRGRAKRRSPNAGRK